MELIIDSHLRCPAGTPGHQEKKFEMVQIYRLEARQNEVSNINKVTAAEFMQAMIDGYGAAMRAVVQLQYELTIAEKHAEQRKAVVYLEVAPEQLKAKGLVRASNPAGSEDLRRAVLMLDAEYIDLMDRVNAITAAVEFLKLKAKGFENTYQAAKKVFDGLSSTNALVNGVNRVSGAAPYAPELPNTLAVGKPQY